MSRRLFIVVLALALALLASRSQAAVPVEEIAEAGGAGFSTQSGWSSGWVPLTPNNPVTLNHGLGGDPLQYAVQLWFRDTDGDYGINNRAYGGLESEERYYGGLWRKLTDSDVEISRSSGDTYADELRIWVWHLEDEPAYCSGWTSIAAGGSQLFIHNVGGDPLDYVVSLWFRGSAAYGINQQGFGGMEDRGNARGAWWHSLTASSVTVERGANDLAAPEVRVCITVADPPAYDSDWVGVPAGSTATLAHHLGGRLDRYIVRAEFRDTDPAGIGLHLRDVGGNATGAVFTGAAWQNLTNQNIGVYRYPDDTRTDQVRVRIWRRTTSVFLPCVIRGGQAGGR